MVLGLGAAACDDTSGSATGRPVSDQEARAVLAKAVAIVQSGDLGSLCPSMGAGADFCTTPLNDLGLAAATPSDAPEVVGSHAVAMQPGIPDGRVLTVTGVDARGAPYESDFLVVRDTSPSGLAAPYPVYWYGVRVGPNNASR